MKAIFLDIDGVLNGDYLYTLPYQNQPRCQGYLGISLKQVRELAWIIEQASTEKEPTVVVLTSSWKYDYDDYVANGYKNKIGKYLREKLRRLHITIYETTTKYEPAHYLRGSGIKNYLKEHADITAYVILDDECYNDYYGENPIISHFIHTDPMFGLTHQNAIAAVDILNSEKVLAKIMTEDSENE